MAVRTNPPAVRAVAQCGDTVPVDPFIKTATALVDWLEAKDDAQDDVLTAGLLTEIETYLAAHYYHHKDQLLQSKSNLGASGQFQGQTGMGLKSTQYGQTAIDLDVSGILATLGTPRQRVSVRWLGTEDPDDPSQQ